MSGRSHQPTLWSDADPSTLSSEGSPVRTYRSRGKAPASRRASAPASGASLPGLPGICGHGGSSPRTCLLCAIAARISSSATWRQSATPSGRSWWVLTTAAPHTGASGSLSSDTWPTPTVHGNHNHKGASPKAGDGLATAVMRWPTAQARDWKGPSGRSLRGLERDLPAAVLWPTPTRDCATERTQRYAQGGLPLTAAVQMWPTPRARDCQAEELEVWQKRQDAISTAGGATFRASLEVAVQMWPTPHAHEARLGYQHRHPDARGSQVSLTTVAMDTEGMAPLRGQPIPDSPSTRGKSRASLNPEWVAQLMGFPADFLDGVAAR